MNTHTESFRSKGTKILYQNRLTAKLQKTRLEYHEIDEDYTSIKNNIWESAKEALGTKEYAQIT